MASPTVRGAGTFAASNGNNVTPTLPAGVAAGDLLIVIVSTKDNVSCSVSGYTRLDAGLPILPSASRQLDAFYKTAGASEGNPTVTHAAGNTIIANMIAITTGTWDTADPFGGYNESTTNGVIPGVAPDVADCLMVLGIHVDNDLTTLSAVSWDGLTWTTRFDDETALGIDASVMCATAPKATTTSPGNGTYSTAAGNSAAFLVAVRPVAAAASLVWQPAPPSLYRR